jgi:hypothetical protein
MNDADAYAALRCYNEYATDPRTRIPPAIVASAFCGAVSSPYDIVDEAPGTTVARMTISQWPALWQRWGWLLGQAAGAQHEAHLIANQVARMREAVDEIKATMSSLTVIQSDAQVRRLVDSTITDSAAVSVEGEGIGARTQARLSFATAVLVADLAARRAQALQLELLPPPAPLMMPPPAQPTATVPAPALRTGDPPMRPGQLGLPCQGFKHGRCRFGDGCWYLHQR